MPVRTISRTPDPRRDTVKLLYLQGLTPAIIAAQTGVLYGTVRKWVSRDGLAKLRSKAKQTLVDHAQGALIRESASELRRASQQIRSRLSSELASQVELLARSPARSIAALANSPARQGRTALVKSLAEAAALVHDWDSDKPAGIILAVDLRQGMLTGPSAVVDVPSLPQDAPGEVGLIADTLPAAEPDPPSTQSG